MICFTSLETIIIKILNQITYQKTQKILLIIASIHEIKLEVIPPCDPITHAFDENKNMSRVLNRTSQLSYLQNSSLKFQK